MIRPILQYRPLDRGFLVCLPEPADTYAWQRVLRWLASLPPDPERLGGSLAYWAAALRLLQSLVIRGALLPQLDTKSNPWRATWGISLTSPSDRELLDKLVKAMPPSAYAFPEDDMWVFTKGLALGTLDTEELEDELAMPPR